jgi:hypothetical protein
MPPPQVTLPEHEVGVIDIPEDINVPFVQNVEVREELINEDLVTIIFSGCRRHQQLISGHFRSSAWYICT